MTEKRHPLAIPKKPVGVVTRGKTARNRLRQVDNFLLLFAPSLISNPDSSMFVDLGYGAEAVTTLESAARFRKLNRSLKILGVEIEPERVSAAQTFADENTLFRLGGFNLPLFPGETVRAIRAFNVLRQYDEADVLPAWEQMAYYVMEGGLLIEGTSNPTGGIWAANILQKNGIGWKHRALVFFTNFQSGFDPEEFQTILPKNYIHHVIPGDSVFEFFNNWKLAAAETSPLRVWGYQQWFVAAAISMEKRGYKIDLRKKFLSRGWMILRDPVDL